MDILELQTKGNEEKLLRVIRTVVQVSYYDDRSEDDYLRSLREILVLTAHVGNEPVDYFDWKI